MANLYKPFQMIYKELTNSEDIAQDFLFVGPKIQGSLNCQKGLLFGSLYFCYIDQCVKNLDNSQIKQSKLFFKALTEQNSLIENEKKQINQIQQDFTKILKELKIFYGCQECEECKKANTCKNFENEEFNKSCEYLSNLENLFFKKQNKENYIFNEHFEFCASLALMEKLVNYSQDNQLSNDQVIKKHNIIFNLDLQNELLTAYMQSAFKQVCQILNISCTLYIEFEDNLVKISEFQSLSNNELFITYNYNIIFNYDYTSFRFGYNTTKANELNMLKDKIYSQNDILQIVKQAGNISSTVQNLQEIKQKELDITDFNNNKIQLLQIFKELKEKQKENAPILEIWINHINGLKEKVVELKAEIEIMTVDLQRE
ncbi:hypothetical protein ABPG72_005667 [Tetrahymena utriculariae]